VHVDRAIQALDAVIAEGKEEPAGDLDSTGKRAGFI
jgi:hypothetical protein